MPAYELGNSTEARIDVLRKIQAYLLPLADIDYEHLATLEQHDIPVMPTIGSEVEVPWSSRFPAFSKSVFSQKPFTEMSEEEKAHFNVLCDELDDQYLPLYKAVTALGVPRDANQKFWEFAHRPVRHYSTLATEIGILMRSDLIPTDHALPFHVTLGNIKIGSGVYFIQLLAEIAGGATAERIRAPIGDMPIYNRRWARKAHNGLKERKAYELRGADYGVELRTFVLNSITQGSQVLRTSQLLGASLNAYRDIQSGREDVRGLSVLWRKAVLCAKRIEGAGILLDAGWGGPAENPKIWRSYADFLEPGGPHSSLLLLMMAELEEIVAEIELKTTV